MVPTPSASEMITPQSADVERANEIRLKMQDHTATRQEVLWLSQNAPRREVDLGGGVAGMSGGFVSAVKGLNKGNQ